MKKRVIIPVAIVSIVSATTAADAFGFKLPGFIRNNLPAPINGVLNQALNVPSSILNSVAGKVSEKASGNIDKWTGKQVDNILGAMGIVDPVAAGDQAGESLSKEDLSGLASGVVSETAQQGAVEQVTQQALGQSGQDIQVQQVEATAQASQGVSEAASQGKEIPVTQKKLDALLDQNAQLSRIMQTQTQIQQQNVQQSAATAHGVNQLNKRETSKDLAEIRKSEADANEMLNNSAFGSAVGTGRYY